MLGLCLVVFAGVFGCAVSVCGYCLYCLWFVGAAVVLVTTLLLCGMIGWLVFACVVELIA